MADVIVATKRCGCVRGLLSTVDMPDAELKDSLAEWIRAGCRIQTMPLEQMRAMSFHCADHPKQEGLPL
jgi:hypothetical protein